MEDGTLQVLLHYTVKGGTWCTARYLCQTIQGIAADVVSFFFGAATRETLAYTMQERQAAQCATLGG
jgi:hypothetical protein